MRIAAMQPSIQESRLLFDSEAFIPEHAVPRGLRFGLGSDIFLPMMAILQAGPLGRVPGPPEALFLVRGPNERGEP